jgi:hypothetical protein
MSDLTNVIVVDGVRVVTHTPHNDGGRLFRYVDRRTIRTVKNRQPTEGQIQ